MGTRIVKFFVPGRIESGNPRSRMHWAKRYGSDKKKQMAWIAIFNTVCPEAARVQKPHQKRRIRLRAARKRKLDYDNLVAGLKPFIDILRCRRHKKLQVLLHEGVIWDDSPEFVDWDISQVTGPGIEEGIEVEIEIRPEIGEA